MPKKKTQKKAPKKRARKPETNTYVDNLEAGSPGLNTAGPEAPPRFVVSNCNFTGTGREASAAAVASALGDNARALQETAKALGELAKGLQGPMVQFG
jgi:hypothetical protein